MFRRNSRISLIHAGKLHYVHKCYHAKYSAEEEAACYKQVATLSRNQRGFRTAQVLGVDEKNNAILIEYIEGPTLFDEFRNGGFKKLYSCKARIVSLLAAARMQNICFDSDPSNFICDLQTGELVIIDPICENLLLPDFCMVVFLLGIIKSFIKSQKYLQYIRWQKCWMEYYKDYLNITNTSYLSLNKQICTYIERVIMWNINENHGEIFMKRLFRRCVVIPFWTTIRFVFKQNLIRQHC